MPSRQAVDASLVGQQTRELKSSAPPAIKRVYLHKNNGQVAKQGGVVLLMHATSLEALLDDATQKLSLVRPAKRLYTLTGAVMDNWLVLLRALNSDDSASFSDLVVSTGESFVKRVDITAEQRKVPVGSLAPTVQSKAVRQAGGGGSNGGGGGGGGAGTNKTPKVVVFWNDGGLRKDGVPCLVLNGGRDLGAFMASLTKPLGLPRCPNKIFEIDGALVTNAALLCVCRPGNDLEVRSCVASCGEPFKKRNLKAKKIVNPKFDSSARAVSGAGGDGGEGQGVHSREWAAQAEKAGRWAKGMGNSIGATTVSVQVFPNDGGVAPKGLSCSCSTEAPPPLPPPPQPPPSSSSSKAKGLRPSTAPPAATTSPALDEFLAAATRKLRLPRSGTKAFVRDWGGKRLAASDLSLLASGMSVCISQGEKYVPGKEERAAAEKQQKRKKRDAAVAEKEKEKEQEDERERVAQQIQGLSLSSSSSSLFAFFPLSSSPQTNTLASRGGG